MKKYFIEILATILILATLLSGCGNAEPASSSPSPTETEAGSENAGQLTETDIGNENAGQPTETEIGSENVGQPVETEGPTEAPPEEENLSGLMILTCMPKGYKYVNGSITYILQCFNMDTGKVTDVAQFDVNPDATVEYPILDQHNFYVNSQDLFSKDYDKLAITARFTSDHSKHTGWIDESGQFFDVTEALGLAPDSDFADPVYCCACGFAEDGSFVFEMSESGEFYKDRQYFSVDPDNLDPAAIREGNPYLGRTEYYDENHKGTFPWWTNYHVTDWVDDTHCIADVGDHYSTTMLIDIDAEESTMYMPSTSRKCWDGVVSPEGDRIAFLSQPEHGNELPSLFVVPTSGGDPVKVDAPIAFTYKEYAVDRDNGFTTIIDWR